MNIFSTHCRQRPMVDGGTITIPTIQISAFETYKDMLTREQLRKVSSRESGALEGDRGLWACVSSLFCILFGFYDNCKVYWLAGAAIFSAIEGWTFFDGLYFCMIFFLTIGYVCFQEKDLTTGGLCRFVARWSSNIHRLLPFRHSNHDYFDFLYV